MKAFPASAVGMFDRALREIYPVYDLLPVDQIDSERTLLPIADNHHHVAAVVVGFDWGRKTRVVGQSWK